MKTKIKFIPLLLACMLAISAFSGCKTTETTTNKPIITNTVQGSSTSLAGSWEKDDGVLTFVGGDSGTFSFDSTGMYDDSGSYSIASDGTLTIKFDGETGADTYRHVSSAAEVENETWCIDGDVLYFGSSYAVYTRKIN